MIHFSEIKAYKLEYTYLNKQTHHHEFKKFNQLIDKIDELNYGRSDEPRVLTVTKNELNEVFTTQSCTTLQIFLKKMPLFKVYGTIKVIESKI